MNIFARMTGVVFLAEGWPLAAGLLVSAGCSAAGGDSTANQMAALTTGLATGSEMSSAPELAGLVAGLMPPRIPDGHEGFRCDTTPTITKTQICGKEFPTSIQLDWTACAARTGPGGHGDVKAGGRADGGRGGVGEGATSAGTVAIDDAVTASNTACDTTTTFSFNRSSNVDITVKETDGTAVRTLAKVESMSTRALTAKTFAQTKVYDITRTDLDAAGATTKTTHLTGQLAEGFDAMATSPRRTLEGTLAQVTSDGMTSTLKLVGVSFLPSSECHWPTTGSIEQTDATGAVHTLVFGATCGQATLDGATITLPEKGPHLCGDGHGRGKGERNEGDRGGGKGGARDGSKDHGGRGAGDTKGGGGTSERGAHTSDAGAASEVVP